MKRIQKLADELRSKCPATPSGDKIYNYHLEMIKLVESHLAKSDPNFGEDAEMWAFRAGVTPASGLKIWRVGYKGSDGKNYQKTISEDDILKVE